MSTFAAERAQALATELVVGLEEMGRGQGAPAASKAPEGTPEGRPEGAAASASAGSAGASGGASDGAAAEEELPLLTARDMAMLG